MSKKDFDKYYNEVKDQYYEMLENLKELESMSHDTMVSPDTMENIRALLEPIKNNYLTLSYVSFLLDTPRRTSKMDSYVKRNKEKLKVSEGYHSSDIVQKNESLLKELGDEIHGRNS